VSDSFFGSGGLELGGQGDWSTARNNVCRLFLCTFGLRNTLSKLTAAWEGKYRVGLYQNDYTPHLTTVLANIVECTFSGYAGRLLTYSWSAPAMVGIYARSVAHDLLWTHNGGPVENFVYGYFVVDQAGLYVWAERFCPRPLIMSKEGQKVRIRPTFYVVNDI